jgi:hypothetical protein
MSTKTFLVAAFGLVLVSLVATTGCSTAYGPSLGILSYPIPLSPYFQDKQEDHFWHEERYDKVPVLGPIVGEDPAALDPPSHDEIMRKLQETRKIEGGLPLLHEVQLNNVRIVVDLIEDKVDPPRVYPLIGPARLHHCRYKCSVYFSEVTRVGWPIPYTTVNEDAQEVIYIDHSHLHMVGNLDPGKGANF